VPFLERDGVYWGPPAGDLEAIAELERLRQAGADFVAIAWPAFWWLDHYAGLREHLAARYACVARTDRVVVFDLGTGSGRGRRPGRGAPRSRRPAGRPVASSHAVRGDPGTSPGGPGGNAWPNP
jgi:hypothetical protein